MKCLHRQRKNTFEQQCATNWPPLWLDTAHAMEGNVSKNMTLRNWWGEIHKIPMLCSYCRYNEFLQTFFPALPFTSCLKRIGEIESILVTTGKSAPFAISTICHSARCEQKKNVLWRKFKAFRQWMKMNHWRKLCAGFQTYTFIKKRNKMQWMKQAKKKQNPIQSL